MKNINIFIILIFIIGINLIAQDSFYNKLKNTASTSWEKTKKLTQDASHSKIGKSVRNTANTTYDKTTDFIKEKTQPSTTQKIWTKTKDISSNIWNTTKKYSSKALDKSKEFYQDIKE